MSTPLKIFNLPFQCVKLIEADFSDVAAIYVILCVETAEKWSVLDVGESGQVGSRINDHDRSDCWSKNCPNKNIWVCIYKTPTAQYTSQQRRDLENKIRSHYMPTCGDR